MSSDPSSSGNCAVRFVLNADASPGLLSRLLEPFAPRDLIPDRVTARANGSSMRVEIGLRPCRATCCHTSTGNLRQVVGLRGLVRDAAPPAWGWRKRARP